MTLIRRGSAKRLHEARKAWLETHPEAYAEVPGIREDVSEIGRQRLDVLCDRLRALGLLGSGNSWGDVQRETVRRLISELRGESVGQGGW